ncbi:large subunit ribosomal protein L24 [Proteiniborus ethanoligenes]|uniref:Large ribosomal subunit protein uL24 n=1 Tax=Proteiniborus ethanoligenes TaxID=415015 RepID=A0A1H3S2V4_9FIRM|nr:50S ribosomal protein L24 [Proteiniborus ethanoligenes]SDZ31499.1 large subunit ribosomal protein L24 [Proteiniborus ethanoligenes]
MHVKKGDTVVVISGKDKGKKGKVLAAMPKTDRVIVEGVNMLTKHKKPNAQLQQGGIIHQEGSIHVSNVMLYCNKDKTGVRVGHKILENGEKVRVCKKCGETL